MQRYSVTIVSPGSTGGRPTLLIPFKPSSAVLEFINELWKRVARQNLSLAPNTHIATLHIDSETGAIIDEEDILSDVVQPDKEKIFAVFASKDGPQPSTQPVSGPVGTEDTVNVRIITPALCKDRSACPVISVPLNSTIRQLHDRIADQHLHIRPLFDEDAELLECNCNLAKQLADASTHRNDCFVVHGKSTVERLHLTSPTEAALKVALRTKFGVDIESKRRVKLRGADMSANDATIYKKPPVIAICSKQRHAPKHARVDVNETGQRKFKMLDLHTSEQPIHPACMNATISEAGLGNLAVDGVVDIFAIDRTTTGNTQPAVGKSSIYRSRACWEPAIIQSDRGMAMFLSSLRVFASLVQDMRGEERGQDAVLHVFDLLTHGFSPALRTLHILTQDKTPTEVECSALSHAIFHTLDCFIPMEIVGMDRSRIFEGSRLLFGFVLEAARTLRLPQEEGACCPYLTSFQAVDLRDHKTDEPVMHAVQTPKGLMEANLFKAFEDGRLLFDSDLQPFLVGSDIDPCVRRFALLSGGVAADLVIFSKKDLDANYRYADAGNIEDAIDRNELTELTHLAELCGRNKLAVHKPSQLASAVAPCLTFDRKAHLAVYTGEQPCSAPGHSSMIFRPHHGEEVIDAAVVEQLISPILQSYEADGTAVFCMLGGAEAKRLQTPDELLVFCVDTSASMRSCTDFPEVNSDDDLQDTRTYGVQVQPEFYDRLPLDEIQERVCSYEGFDDMVAIVGEALSNQKRPAAMKTLRLLKMMLSAEMTEKFEKLDAARQSRLFQHRFSDLETELDELKAFWAGLTTHEQALCDLLLYRAQSSSRDIAARWRWSIGQAVPAPGPLQEIPALDAAITEIPHRLLCPISRSLMLDAATAGDGHTYSQFEILKWFQIRRSSPMTGLDLLTTDLTASEQIRKAAAHWVTGDDLIRHGVEPQPSNEARITFDSKVGSFIRTVTLSMTAFDLYRLAFRGLKARYSMFQLATERSGALPASSSRTLSSLGIRNGDRISVRIASEEPVTHASNASGNSRSDSVLVKVYGSPNVLLFAYWVKKDTSRTLSALLWKYWRHTLGCWPHQVVDARQVWTDMSNSGDGLVVGSPQKATRQLSAFLTPGHCFGTLVNEPVYREAAESAEVGQPLVLKVQICRPQDPNQSYRLSRLDVLKQMFEALSNKVQAYGFQTHIGLVSFDSTARVTMGISHVLENFRRATHDMKAEGDTSLWDALALCKDQLVEYGKKYPEAKKRIICISDGVDTKSTSNTSDGICWQLHQAGVAVDSVSLGQEDNDDLRTLSSVLGCYSFHPTSLVNALTICEMEPFLSLSERPAISTPRPIPNSRLEFPGFFRAGKYRSGATLVTQERVPPRKRHPNLDDDFVELADIVKGQSERAPTSAVRGPRSNLRTSRLLTELKHLASREHETYDVYCSERDMSFLKVVMSGPDGSPYEQGTFLLYIHADDGFPTFAPKARFITKMLHPNVNAHGKICHSIVDRDWTSDTSISTLLDTIYGLLLQAESSDPVNTMTTLGYHHDQVEFAEAVRDHVSRHAVRSREEWRNEILGFDDSEEEEDEEEDEEYEEDEEDEE